MKLFWNFFKQKCMVGDDQAHPIDNVYSAQIHVENNAEKLQNKLEAAKNYLGEKYILHPKHNVKRKNAVKHLTLENV
jgi:hypothetical protein